MPLQHLKLDVRDHVATVTLDRPPVNALGRAIREELLRTFDELHDRDDVRVVILAASGRTFCAGADIKERTLLTGKPGEYRELNRLVREVFYAVIQCSKPVIAAVNGSALGAGFAIALCCDLILASDDAVFGMPEVDVGLAGGVKFLQRLLHAFAVAHAAPDRPPRAGGGVASPRRGAGGRARAGPPAGSAETRDGDRGEEPDRGEDAQGFVQFVENLSLEDGYRIEQDMTVELSKTEDAQEAKQAFVEKRKPVFKGR